MDADAVLDKLSGVKVVRPSDLVVRQIRRLITENVIKPGDTLPSENQLAKRFEISKGYVREAIKILELYGVVKSIPGVGTIVNDLGMQSLNNFIINFLQFSVHDYRQLLEVRALIEPFTAYRAATNATDEELAIIGDIHDKLSQKIEKDEVDLGLECSFHIEIAKASHNTVLATTMTAMLPGLIEMIEELDIAKDGRNRRAHVEHTKLYEALKNRDPQAAEQAMQLHMQQTDVHFSVRVSDIEVRHSERLKARKKD